jgi:hypothetical protein
MMDGDIRSRSDSWDDFVALALKRSHLLPHPSAQQQSKAAGGFGRGEDG